MRWTIALLMAMFACSVAQADVFEWVDPKGVTHFTDDLNKVPAKYREKAKRRESATGDEGAASESLPRPAPGPASGEQKSMLYGGHDETWWRASFKALRDEMQGIQDKLPAKREELVALHRKRLVYQQARDRVSYYDMKGEIEKDEARIKEIEGQLTSLDADATKAGVPFEWRK